MDKPKTGSTLIKILREDIDILFSIQELFLKSYGVKVARNQLLSKALNEYYVQLKDKNESHK
jgi:hypothetical protein